MLLDGIQILLLGYVAFLLVGKQKPSMPAVRKRTARKLIIDTCALIDGRIVELARAGFVPEQLIIPEFIIHELQLLADGTDSHKRDRARYGLDIVQELQDNKNCDVIIDRSAFPEKHATDDKLVALAKKLHVSLYTTDFNLNKVAEIEGVKVLNVNELAGALRPSALPGEKKTVKILQKGSNPRQGVGYLEDGTMLVVEDAAAQVGKTVQVEITRMHQTVSGKMLFSELIRPSAALRTKTASGPRLAARKPSHSLASRMKH
ncbi:MAG TPA: TRAM domain-containing protein [Verrucomicrobiae bacterium]|nr:TRAM domain-containing protein [Verrucomicrobiae bacterium]